MLDLKEYIQYKGEITMAVKLMQVVGHTEKGIEIIGEFMYGRMYKGKTTYYIADKYGIIHECTDCKEL
jgi:hypothetical protein